MKEKLLGSVVVSHYGPFEKGGAEKVSAELLKADSCAYVLGGTCADGREFLTVFSRNGDDPELTLGQFYGIAASVFLGIPDCAIERLIRELDPEVL